MVSLSPELYPFQENFFTCSEGHQLHYVDEGPKDGPIILMVHGNPSWSFLYRDVIKDLSSKYRCIAIDHLGCGKSAQPLEGPYDLAHHISRLGQLVKHLDLKNITLLLHDWGGAIGMGMANNYPDRIKAISLFNTAAFTDTRIPRRIALCRWPVLGPFLNLCLNAFARGATVMALPKGARMSAKVKSGFLYPYSTARQRRAINAFVQDIPMGPTHPTWSTLKNVEEGLSKFSNHPVKIFWGEQDFCFNTHFYERWKKVWPHAETDLFSDGGHYLLETHAKKVSEALDSWMTKN
jgi:cis-3-alkyl-4-acyloxetan-2-one decarboxylase